VAGWDDRQMVGVVCLRRDRNGSLVRQDDNIPQWVRDTTDSEGNRFVANPRPFGSMFRQVKKRQGLSEEEASKAWVGYISELDEHRRKLSSRG